jgi:type I restriction enzyme S subunit
MTWELKSVSELCEFAIDCVNKTAPVVDCPTSYKMIRTNNVKNGFIDIENVRYVDEDTFKKWTRRSKPLYGDVILTREAPVGDVGRFTSKSENVFLGQRLFHYRPNPDLLDWNYFAYVLQSQSIQSWLHGIAFGATVPHIKVEDAENLQIPCPPIEIQRKIGSILSAYDDLIENNLQRIKLLEEMAQITYEEWFVRMRFPGHETAQWDKETGLPEGWAKIPLGNMMIFHYGKALRSHEKRKGNIPIYSSAGIFGYHDTSLVDAPGIIVGRKGNVGSVFWSQEPFFPMDTVYYVESKESLYFAYFALKSVEFINNDAAVPGLNRNAAYAMKIISPVSELIECFEEKVKPTFATVFNLKKQNELLREAREILLPRLMTGVIDVDQVEVPEALLARVA